MSAVTAAGLISRDAADTGDHAVSCRCMHMCDRMRHMLHYPGVKWTVFILSVSIYRACKDLDERQVQAQHRPVMWIVDCNQLVIPTGQQPCSAPASRRVVKPAIVQSFSLVLTVATAVETIHGHTGSLEISYSPQKRMLYCFWCVCLSVCPASKNHWFHVHWAFGPL